MRSLSSTLLAEQRKASYTPYIRIYLPNYSGGTDLTSYCKEGVHTEQVFGGGASLKLVDLSSWYFVSGDPIDLRGQQVNIGYGFVLSGGNEYSEAGPLWIRNTRLISYQGVLAVQIECYDIWEKLGMIRAAGDAVSDTAKVWESDTTVYAIIDELLTAQSITLTKDSSDGIVDSLQPYYEANINDSILDIIIDMIGMTNCGIKSRQDGIHIFKLPTSGSSHSYSYDLGGAHVFFSCLEDEEIVVPNKIMVVDDYDEATYEAVATDEDSYSQLGFYSSRKYAIPGISSNSEAAQFAEAIMSAVRRSFSKGLVIVPHNCGQELFDHITVTDTRWPS